MVGKEKVKPGNEKKQKETEGAGEAKSQCRSKITIIEAEAAGRREDKGRNH